MNVAKQCSPTFLDDFPKQISTSNSYPLAVLMPIYDAIKLRIENEAKGKGFGIQEMIPLSNVK